MAESITEQADTSLAETQTYRMDVMRSLMGTPDIDLQRRIQKHRQDTLLMAERETMSREEECQRQIEDSRRESQMQAESQAPDTQDDLFAKVALGIGAVSAAEWARQNGFQLRPVSGGWVCRELPDISFYEDGTFSSSVSDACGGSLEFATEVQGLSIEESVVRILSYRDPVLLEQFRSRPPRRSKPDIELMHPQERIRKIRSASALTADTEEPQQRRPGRQSRGRSSSDGLPDRE